MDYANMKLGEVSKLDGVEDIKPALARGKFAQALIAEAKGEHDKAEEKASEAADLAIN